MTDETLKDLLRSAFPQTLQQGPSQDLWPQIINRIGAPAEWSWLDTSVAAGVTIAVLIFPRALLLIAYQL